MITLQIINCSVDPIDPSPDYVPEDLSINEMETITEIIAEEVLDIEDCFPEQDDHDNPDKTSFEVVKLVTTILSIESIKSPKYDIKLRKLRPSHYRHYAHQCSPEIDAPPPKLAA